MVATLLLTFCLSLARDLPIPPDGDPFTLNEEMKQFLEQNIDRSGDSVEQLRSLVRVVFQQNAPDEAWKLRYTEKLRLLASMQHHS